MKKYFYVINEVQFGPLSLDEILEKKLDNEILVWHEGLPEWVKLSDLPELKSNQILPPPINGSKKGNRGKRILFTSSLLFLIILGAGFYYYPKWKVDQVFKENTQKFNDVMTVFKRTDSIDFVKFEELAKKDFSDANFVLGLYYSRTDNGLKAVEAFEKALKSNFRVPVLYQIRYQREIFGQEKSDKYQDTLSLEFPSWISGISEEDWLSQQFAAKIYGSNPTLFEKTELQSWNKAIEFYEKSINKGSVTSLYLLGKLYSDDEDENGNHTNYPKALEIFKKAADLGLPAAYSEIGYIFMEGIGVEVDFDEAKKWFLKGAQNFSVSGEAGMSELFMEKVELTVEDIDSVNYWNDKAVNNTKDKSEFNQRSRIKPIIISKALKVFSRIKSKIKSRSSQSTSSNDTSDWHKCEWCGIKFTHFGFNIFYGNSETKIQSGGGYAHLSGNYCDKHFCSVKCANEKLRGF